ncbi:MAG: hypothetical protein Q8O67_19925 [Deltaproteobacteria bacterium]|nr:hypothetical protein [Deltaproteobacteria bacterium]
MRFAAAAAAALVLGCDPPLPVIPEAIAGVEQLTTKEGWSIHIPPFGVPPGVEVQDCYFFAFPDLNGDGSPVFIDRFKMGQRTGSHHMNIFRMNTIVHLDGRDGDVVKGGECRISTNWSDWPLVVNTQDSTPGKPAVDWTLPAGVAQKFTPGEILMVQSHYVNADLQETPDGGEVRANFYRSPLENPIEMGTLFATQQSIRVCRSNPTPPPFDGACGFASDDSGTNFHLAAMNGHFHGRGTSFQIYPWDGVTLDHPAEESMIYESTDWEEPPMTIDLDIEVPNNGGIWWSCNYEWQEPAGGCAEVDARDPEQQGDCCYTFGNSAELAEHCNVFAYYWPKTENVFCN